LPTKFPGRFSWKIKFPPRQDDQAHVLRDNTLSPVGRAVVAGESDLDDRVAINVAALARKLVAISTKVWGKMQI
jgi:hypothetical protein